MFTKTRPAFFIPMILTALICGLGCAPPLEEDPAFENLTTGIEEISDDIDAIRRRIATLDTLDGELQKLTRDVQPLLAKGKLGAGATQAIEQRLVRLEQGLKAQAAAQAAMEKKIQGLSDQQAKLAKAMAARPKAATGTGGKPQVKGTAIPAKGSPAPAKPKPKGFYYVIKPGETLDALATRFNVTPQAIRSANHLSAGKAALAGQRLFIPPR